MSSLLDNLNPPQLQAVTFPAQHVLVLAGAGSGKTRVLTTRIAWLVQTGQVSPHGILAVTFTNKAAREMLTRLSAMLPINTRGMWVGTFHGLCNRMLRAHHREAGLPSLFQILDSGDQLSMIKRLIKALNVNDEKYPPRDLQHFINANKEEGLRPPQVEAWDEHTKKRVELYQAYDEQCQREGVVDFAELMLRCYELLIRNEPLRRHYRARFRHILVDEFQDTNRLQYAWLKLLAGAGEAGGAEYGEQAAIFAVGDDDQSIYAFRGARVGNMRDFERDFCGQNIIRLEQNYRSHGNILEAANAIIKHNSARLGKNLWTDAGAGEPIRVYEAVEDGEEARWIVEEARTLSLEGTPRSQIALLYRSNAQSRVLEHQLFAAGIPYRVYGGQRFFERMEIKHALAYLRLVANPDDDGAFLRVVNFPTRGIGARSMEGLQDIARADGTSLSVATTRLVGKPAAAISRFMELIAALRDGTASLPLQERVEHMLDLSGLRAHYRAEKDGQDRLENLDELINAAANFVAEQGTLAPTADGEIEATPVDMLAAFLAHASLEAGDHQADEGQEAIQLMTVHAAKGLEFDVVFLSGLEEGLFPHENSAMERDGLEEERRLMYVAVTRARQRLYLSFAQTRMLHGQTRYSLKSRFLEEIPQALTKWLTPPRVRERSGAWGGGFGGAGPAGGFTGGRMPSATPAVRVGRSPFADDDSEAAPQGGGSGFRIGQNVVHAKFGKGVIVAAEGSGSDARVQVNFGREGVKWLALAFAKLAPA